MGGGAVRLPGVTLTPALAAWLSTRGDGAPLSVRQDGPDVVVLRADGAEPLSHEAIRCQGIVAAHAAEPFTRPPRGAAS